MKAYEQGDTFAHRTFVTSAVPVEKLEYTFAHEDQPSETITCTFKPPARERHGRFEVTLQCPIPSRQEPGVYRLKSLKVYEVVNVGSDEGPSEADIEKIRDSATFQVISSSRPKDASADGWEEIEPQATVDW